jgi:hypothetical protein
LTETALDWRLLDSGSYSLKEVKEAIDDENWQKYRRALKGKTLHEKWLALKLWLNKHNNSRKAKIQVANYVNALRRAGMVPSKVVS